LLPNIGATDF